MPAAAAAKADNPDPVKTISCEKKETKKKNNQRTEENPGWRNRKNPWGTVDDPEEEEEARDWI